MSLAISNNPIPIETDRDGVIRVGATRVSIDSVISSFQAGATAEEIAYQYPTLQLADIYTVIGYYLKNRDKVDSYLDQRQNIKDQVCTQNQARFEHSSIRARV